MTKEELIRLLDNSLTYKIYSDSLKESEDDSLNYLTESVMNLRTNINKLTNRSVRLVMTLRYVNGYRFNVIAKKMKISYQWVNVLHNRGVNLLLDMYNQG